MGNTPLCKTQRRVSASALGPGLEDESHQVTEENGGGDAACGGGDAAGEGPQKAVFGHGLGHALGQQVAEPGERDGGAGAAPFHHIFIEAQTTQHHTGDHIEY